MLPEPGASPTDPASSPPAIAGPGLPAGWAVALVFFTSAAILVLEIVAGRLLAPIIGESLETYTAVIGTVLAGIAAGNAIGGVMADRSRPERLLGPVLILGGVTSWLAPLIAGVFSEPVTPSPVVIVLLTALTFLAPATVLATVTPLVAALLIDDVGRAGRVVGKLSAVGTAGALLGTFGTGFILVVHFPTRRIVVGVGLLLVLGGIATIVGLARAAGTSPMEGRNAPAALAGIAVVGFGSWWAPDPCTLETPYVCVDLQADPEPPNGIAVVLDGVRNSYVVPDDPTHLEFRYLRLFRDVTTAHVGPPDAPTEAAADGVDVLHIGGAGFSFPRSVRAAWGDAAAQTVLEVDDQLVDVARDRLGLETDEQLEVLTGDARLTIRELATDRYDVVVGDAFSGYTVPWQLTTRQYVAEIDRVLAPDGVIALNLIDGGPLDFVRAELATLAETFDHVAIIVPADSDVLGGPSRNQVVLASHRPLPAITVDPADGVVLDEAATAELIGDAQILDDDFAPVDQLRTG
ncbi:MAG: fused MFS/spermidine synthase [Acidimicrobiales bacterium]